jgi:hypothetical protein
LIFGGMERLANGAFARSFQGARPTGADVEQPRHGAGTGEPANHPSDVVNIDEIPHLAAIGVV